MNRLKLLKTVAENAGIPACNLSIFTELKYALQHRDSIEKYSPRVFLVKGYWVVPSTNKESGKLERLGLTFHMKGTTV